jgi:hypothetical protein
MRAPRASAASQGSSTSMPAPSPRIMPWRSRENGRQVSGETTRMASQAFRMPKLNGASLPPANARSTMPERTIQNAWPMACAAEEQAVEMVKLGPVMPNSMEMWLAPALAMVLGMVSGCTRLWASL